MVEAYGKKARQMNAQETLPQTRIHQGKHAGRELGKRSGGKERKKFFFPISENGLPSPYKASLQSYSYNYTALRSLASVALYMNTMKDIFLFQCT